MLRRVILCILMNHGFPSGSAFMLDSVRRPKLADNGVASGYDGMFDVLDRDHDGVISKIEFETALKGDIIDSPLINLNDGTMNSPTLVAKSCANATQQLSYAKVKRVSCVGDSITRGACGSDYTGYPDRMQSLLGDGYHVSKFGADGRGLLDTGFFPIWNENGFLEKALASEPDIVVIMFGTNDAKLKDFDDAIFVEQYHKFANMFIGLKSRPKIFVVAPPPVYSADSAEHNVIAPHVNTQLRGTVEKMASADSNFNFIDVFSRFQSSCHNLNSTSCRLIAHESPPPAAHKICHNDYVHPSDEGYSLIAELVAKAITEE